MDSLDLHLYQKVKKFSKGSKKVKEVRTSLLCNKPKKKNALMQTALYFIQVLFI